MSKGGMTMTNDDITDDLQDHINENQVYKILRQRSASLALIITILFPILLFFFNVACTTRHSIIESLQQVYNRFEFDLDCLAIVLGWILIQVRIKNHQCHFSYL